MILGFVDHLASWFLKLLASRPYINLTIWSQRCLGLSGPNDLLTFCPHDFRTSWPLVFVLSGAGAGPGGCPDSGPDAGGEERGDEEDHHPHPLRLQGGQVPVRGHCLLFPARQMIVRYLPVKQMTVMCLPASQMTVRSLADRQMTVRSLLARQMTVRSLLARQMTVRSLLARQMTVRSSYQLQIVDCQSVKSSCHTFLCWTMNK